MKLLKRLLLGALVLISVTAAVLFTYLYSTKPTYEGSITLTGISQPVEVVFDDFGVPHIYAENEKDAHFALGYLHAQDRLFQMEMIRRVSRGELSEVLGPDFIKTDQFFRTLQLVKQAEKSAKLLFSSGNKEVIDAALAYQEGVNQYIEEGHIPIEFRLMGIPLEKFVPEDMYMVVGFMSVGFAEGFRSDPVLTYVREKYGPDYLKSLAVSSIPGTSFIPSYDTAVFTSDFSLAMSEVLDHLPVSLFQGSNGWVVSGEKSVSGKPILANDTHMAFSQPSVWYEAYMEYPGQKLYGHYAAGFPFAILGHNQSTAWGITMLENDDSDFYIEELNPQDSLQVMIDSTWHSMDTFWDTVKVKGENPVIYPIKNTLHGPIVNSVLTHFPKMIKKPVSLWWEFLKKPSKMLESAYLLNHATSVFDIQRSAGMINAPGLNLMTADTSGNIGWFTTARLITRPKHVQPDFFLRGTGEDDPIGEIPSSHNPHAINPPSGFVYSANNQPDSIGGILIPGYFYPQDRAMRIVELLQSKEKFSTDDMRVFNLDHTSSMAERVSQVMVNAIKTQELSEQEQQVIDILSNWKGDHLKSSTAPTLYYTLLSNALYMAMEDEIGKSRFNDFTTISVMKRSYLMFMSDENSPWWDNLRTEEKETRADILKQALGKTLEVQSARLGNDINQWQWEKVHTLTHPHPLGQVDLLKPIFNVGPFKVNGGNEVINNLMFKLNPEGLFEVTGGPALRKVIDMADLSGARSVLPSGESGNMMSPHYGDQAKMYAEGETRPLLMNKETLKKGTHSILMLNPHEIK